MYWAIERNTGTKVYLERNIQDYCFSVQILMYTWARTMLPKQIQQLYYNTYITVMCVLGIIPYKIKPVRFVFIWNLIDI